MIVSWTEVKFPGVKRDWPAVPKLCAYLHSEVTEAFEAWRDDDKPMVGEELADLVIRAFDYAGSLGYDLAAEMVRKMEINEGRPAYHGRVNV